MILTGSANVTIELRNGLGQARIFERPPTLAFRLESREEVFDLCLAHIRGTQNSFIEFVERCIFEEPRDLKLPYPLMWRMPLMSVVPVWPQPKIRKRETLPSPRTGLHDRAEHWVTARSENQWIRTRPPSNSAFGLALFGEVLCCSQPVRREIALCGSDLERELLADMIQPSRSQLFGQPRLDATTSCMACARDSGERGGMSIR